MGERICSIDGCEGPTVARGWCDKHYRRWRKHGDPLVTKRIIGDDEARFWSYVRKAGPDECWQWIGAICGAPRGPGYGHLNIGGRPVMAHRYAYEQSIGPIPDGLVLDHRCRNQHCVNPAHLEPVTQRENVHRGLLLKIPEERIAELANLRRSGATFAELARAERVSSEAISRRIKQREERACRI